ncbi:MAG TPA: KR domain-containing protein, partial [Pyrinomonadaceae bacterium]
ISNLTGTQLSAEDATSPHYWARQLRETVRFADGLGHLLEQPHQILLEVGPGQSLSAQARRHSSKRPSQVIISSTRHQEDSGSDVGHMLTALGRLWLSGVRVDWHAFHAHERRQRQQLPTYPFERQRYWIDPPRRDKAESRARSSAKLRAAAAQKNQNISDWFYLPYWKPAAPLAQTRPAQKLAQTTRAQNNERGSRLVFISENSFSLKVLDRLEEEAGGTLIRVWMGEGFAKLGERAYSVNPRRAEDYKQLLDELRSIGQHPGRVLHFWNISTETETQRRAQGFEHYQRAGFASLLCLGKILGEHNDPVEIIVFSTNVQSVTGTEDLSPEKVTLLSPCKTISQEYPHLTCRSIDLVLAEAESWQESKLIEQLVLEAKAATSERALAYRNGSRLAQTFASAPFGEQPESPVRLRAGGVYLMTGGLGRIGLALAESVAGATRGKLVLVGRSPFPAKDEWAECLKTLDDDETCRKIRRLMALEAAGAEVLILKADVTREDELLEVCERTVERFGQLNGVIHAAGIGPEQSFRLIKESEPTEADLFENPKLLGL